MADPATLKRPKAATRLALSIVLGALGQSAFKLGFHVLAGFALYAVAAWVFIRSLGGEKDAPELEAAQPSGVFDSRRSEGLLVLALAVVAAFFRLYRLDSQPSSLWLDEGLTGLNALAIIEGKSAPLWSMTPLDSWRPDWVKTSNLYLLYVVGVFKVFGTDYFGLKMVSVLPAIAGVLAVYLLFRQLENGAVAFVAAFLTAVSQWHVTISRWGWDAVLMSFLQMISYWLLLKGLDNHGKGRLILGGAVLGLCLYTYIASWIALTIALVFLGLRAVRGRHAGGAAIRDALFFAVPCAMVFAPLGSYYIRHPEDLWVRAREVSLVNAVAAAQNFSPAWESLEKYALMFTAKGDPNPRHGFPAEPALDFVTGIFFVLGLAYSLRGWRDLRTVFVLLWFVLGLQAGLLADPAESPNAYRTLIIAPVVFYFAGAAIYLCFDALRRSLAPRLRNVTLAIVGLTMAGYLIAINYWTYFVKRPATREVWEEESRDGGLPGRLASLRHGDSVIVLDPLLLWKAAVANSWFLNYRPGEPFESAFIPANLLIADSRLPSSNRDRELVYVYSPVFSRMMSALFSGAPNEMVRSPFGDPLYGVATIAVSELRSRLASAEPRGLAAAIQIVASFYRQQALKDGEIGPRRNFLLEESQRAIEVARRLDPINAP
ncbi:MAG TPA: glycosyltransferase family 39 protein [Candidatus Binatia bacterium]|nr:glycosyltransferase family 39 protein [Candidatus Binatia bacterium]